MTTREQSEQPPTRERHEPRTDKGTQTRRRLLEAAEQVFAERGYHDSSIVKITEAAGVAGGTFYIYFKSKQDIFDELVIDLNHRVRQAMAEGSSRGTSRSDAERRGFEAFFRFTGEHPALYRIIRQAEFVSPHTLRLHYERIVQGYVEGLDRAQEAGEIAALDSDVVAWALMGAGELIGMRYVLWDDQRRIPEHVFAETMRFVRRGLGAAADQEEGS
ncbi:MAG TPA: TetR/AcrR family transcriptional regulator [Marmoricola sp.]|jgi:AcrR family transcriptional regulator|nr:TetR/AcrR family transcriptional regulator [Marmoricola sp.]